MMNLKIRFKNYSFIVTFTVAIVAFVYQMLGLFGIVAPISQEIVIQVVGIVTNLLLGLGVLIDPTTKGIGDFK